MKVKIIGLIAAVLMLVAACGSSKTCPAYSDASTQVNTEANS